MEADPALPSPAQAAAELAGNPGARPDPTLPSPSARVSSQIDSSSLQHVLWSLRREIQGAAPMSVVAGSCGFIALEYTYTLQVDEKSDVVLLEILTGRRSVEAEYGEGSNIVDWVRRRVSGGGEGWLRDVMATAALAEEGGEVRDEMALTLRVALLCTSRCPQERPLMREVVTMLQEAKPAVTKKQTHKMN